MTSFPFSEDSVETINNDSEVVDDDSKHDDDDDDDNYGHDDDDVDDNDVDNVDDDVDLIILSKMFDFIPFLRGLSRDRIILKSGLQTLIIINIDQN